MGGMMMLLLMLTACSSSSTDEEPQKPKEKPVLKVYLFAPESPIVTRAENYVDPSADEKRINTLDVWVFENNDEHTLVSYIHLANLTFDGQKEISMEISDDFANNPNKPNVDIYVVANVTNSNCGLTLNRDVGYAVLKDKLITENFFGLTSPFTSVPVGGLPMSGFLEDQAVSGTAPVFSAKTKNVQLVRAVSKMRFVFSKSTAAPAISDINISLDNGVLPTKEYLFLKGEYPSEKIHLEDNPTYEASGTESGFQIVSGVSGEDINSCADPASYIYTTETGQAYEDKINAGLTEQTVEGVTKPAELSEVGRFYLRESDKQLKGTIKYTIGETEKSASFEMDVDEAGNYFTRNHTWIIYGYFLGSGTLMLNVALPKDWEEDPENDEVYNW